MFIVATPFITKIIACSILFFPNIKKVQQFYLFLPHSTMKIILIKNSALEYVSLNTFISSFIFLIKFTINHFESTCGQYKKPTHILILKAILSFIPIHIISSISVTIS